MLHDRVILDNNRSRINDYVARAKDKRVTKMHEILNEGSELGDILPMPMPRPERYRYQSNVSNGYGGKEQVKKGKSPRIIAKPR